MAEADLYAQLRGVAALGDRVYPLTAPQNVQHPYVTYQRISATRYSAFGGDLATVEAVMQVDLYVMAGKGYEPMNTTSDAVRSALQRIGSGNIITVFIDAERDDFEEDTELYRKSFDVRAWYRET